MLKTKFAETYSGGYPIVQGECNGLGMRNLSLL